MFPQRLKGTDFKILGEELILRMKWSCNYRRWSEIFDKDLGISEIFSLSCRTQNDCDFKILGSSVDILQSPGWIMYKTKLSAAHCGFTNLQSVSTGAGGESRRGPDDRESGGVWGGTLRGWWWVRGRFLRRPPAPFFSLLLLRLFLLHRSLPRRPQSTPPPPPGTCIRSNGRHCMIQHKKPRI